MNTRKDTTSLVFDLKIKKVINRMLYEIKEIPKYLYESVETDILSELTKLKGVYE